MTVASDRRTGADISTNAALAAAGYTTALSPSYGCKLILKDGGPVGHFDCCTAWDLPGMREVADPVLSTQRKALDALFRNYHAGKGRVPAPPVTPEQALSDIAQALDAIGAGLEAAGT